MSKALSTQKQDNLNLSVSSVETFLSCKAKWYYRYIEKLPSPPSYHLTAGSFIHKILEIFLRRYKKVGDLRDAGGVAVRLAMKDEELSPHLTKEIVQEGKEWIKSLVKKYESDPALIPSVLKIETPFSFKVGEANITIRGYIDRIDQVDENTVRIVDYKTSSNPDYLDPFQLATYSIAVSKKYPGKMIKTAYTLVRHNFSNKEFTISDSDRQQVLDTFIKVAGEIRTLKTTTPDTPWDPTITKLCNYCPFRMRCEKDRNKSSWKHS